MRPLGDVVAAGIAGAACSAIPSTAWSLVRGDNPLEGGRALGQVVFPREGRTAVLLLAAAPAHVAISFGWAAVLAAFVPRRAEPAWAVVAALAIAALDLEVIGRHLPSIRRLPQGRQWADHVAYGLAVGTAFRLRRGSAEFTSPSAEAAVAYV